MRSWSLSIPARINLLGNPGDACEGDFATISAAVDVRAGAHVAPADGVILEMQARAGGGLATLRRLELAADRLPLPYDGEMDLVKGAINRLHQYSAEFRDRLGERGVRIATWTDVPRQSGLGGSSLFVLLALAGLRVLYNLDRRAHNDWVLAELAQRVEARELGITCGYSDRYAPLFGGIVYVDYRGKLHQREAGQEPFATVERLDVWVDSMPLVAVSTGVVRDSGDVHGQMRPRYLAEHDAWSAAGGTPPPMVRLMTAAWRTAWRGKIALLEHDWPTFGALMNENHRLVNEMMRYCGFSDGAGWANNLFIQAALDNGALGAKLTGAGGGGSVFALTPRGGEEAVARAWHRLAEEVGCSSARVYRPRISRRGLIVEAG